MDKFRAEVIAAYFAWCEKNKTELIGLDINQRIDKFIEHERNEQGQ